MIQEYPSFPHISRHADDHPVNTESVRQSLITSTHQNSSFLWLDIDPIQLPKILLHRESNQRRFSQYEFKVSCLKPTLLITINNINMQLSLLLLYLIL